MNARPATLIGSAQDRPVEQWRERFVRPMLIGASIFGFFVLILGLGTNQGVVQNTVFIVSYLLLLLVTLVNFPYKPRISVFLLVLYGLALNELLTTGILGDSSGFFLAFILFAALMWSARAGFVTLGISMLTMWTVGALLGAGSMQLMNAHAMQAGLADWLTTSLTVALFGVTFIIGLRQLQAEFVDTQKRSTEAMAALQAERASLEDRVESRTLQLQAVNEVGRVASSILDPQDLAGRVANLITDHFGYYYAALFLVDEAHEQAWLYNATGEAGRVLKETKHHLKVGGNSMVGMAIATGRPRVALDVGTESVRFQNPLLPYTRSEIALPLVIGERVLGALDVQSTKAGAFGQQEIETLQGMATQVAIALENARLFESAQKSLDEMEAIQGQYITDAWKPYTETQALEYKLGEEDMPVDSEMAVPLALREQIIGEISLGGDGEWSTDERTLIETVAAQAALALENARLVEQSQSSARYEHQLADITSKIWTATTVDSILQTAVKELGQALDASDARIELNMDGSHE